MNRSSDLRKTPPVVLEGSNGLIKTPATAEKGQGYPGAKSIDGVFQRLINIIPPHDILVECCGGSGALTWNIKKAKANFIIEQNISQGEMLKQAFGSCAEVVIASFYNVLDKIIKMDGDKVFYFDPPYLKEVRTWKGSLYKFDWSDDDHRKFLKYVTCVDSYVIVSHPKCEMYYQALKDWNRIEYEYITRGGMRKDCIWFNYPWPKELHDYKWLGGSNMERQCIRRKRHSLLRKIEELPTLQQNAFLEELKSKYGTL